MGTVNSRRRFFFDEKTINVTEFPNKAQFVFGFDATHVIISNDSKFTALFSFLKPHLDGKLLEKDGPIAFDGVSEGKLWFKAEDAAKPVKVRVWAWGKN